MYWKLFSRVILYVQEDTLLLANAATAAVLLSTCLVALKVQKLLINVKTSTQPSAIFFERNCIIVMASGIVQRYYLSLLQIKKQIIFVICPFCPINRLLLFTLDYRAIKRVISFFIIYQFSSYYNLVWSVWYQHLICKHHLQNFCWQYFAN